MKKHLSKTEKEFLNDFIDWLHENGYRICKQVQVPQPDKIEYIQQVTYKHDPGEFYTKLISGELEVNEYGQLTKWG